MHPARHPIAGGQVEGLFQGLLSEAFLGYGRPFNAIGRHIKQESHARQCTSQSLASHPYKCGRGGADRESAEAVCRDIEQLR